MMLLLVVLLPQVMYSSEEIESGVNGASERSKIDVTLEAFASSAVPIIVQ